MLSVSYLPLPQSKPKKRFRYRLRETETVKAKMPQEERNAANRRRTSSCTSERRGSLEARSILGQLGYRRQSAGDASAVGELPPIRPHSRKSSQSSSNGLNRLQVPACNPSSSSMESLNCGSHIIRSDLSGDASVFTTSREASSRRLSSRKLSSNSVGKKASPTNNQSAGIHSAHVTRRSSGMQRNRSEHGMTSNPKPEPRRRPESNSRPLAKTKSQPVLSNSKSTDDLLSEQNLRRLQSCDSCDDCSGDKDWEEDGAQTSNRIIQWLIGVEGTAEKPQSPLPVVEEGPTQTDTAIHIVYEEA